MAPERLHVWAARVSYSEKINVLKLGRSAASSSLMFLALMVKDLLEESHEKASDHRNKPHWQHDALRGAFISAFLASNCRFGRAGYGGCTGRAPRGARQRRGCGAQSYSALRAGVTC